MGSTMYRRGNAADAARIQPMGRRPNCRNCASVAVEGGALCCRRRLPLLPKPRGDYKVRMCEGFERPVLMEGDVAGRAARLAHLAEVDAACGAPISAPVPALSSPPPRPALPAPRAPARTETRAKVLAAMRAGIGCALVARKLGLAKSTVAYHARGLRAEGLLPPARPRVRQKPPKQTPKPKIDATADNRARILAALQAGETNHSAIRRKLGIPHSTMNRHIKALREAGKVPPAKLRKRLGAAPRWNPGAYGKAILAAAKAGEVSPARVAAELGCSQQTVCHHHRHLRALGLLESSA